jgi:hypothetical protein
MIINRCVKDKTGQFFVHGKEITLVGTLMNATFYSHLYPRCFQIYSYMSHDTKVARWPHGCRRKYSEVAVPMLVGSNPTEGGGFFQRKEPPPGHGCVCMSPRG